MRPLLAMLGRLRLGRDKALDDEINAHLAMSTADKVEAGLAPEEARRAALRDFGPVERIKEQTRDGWSWRLASTIVRECRVSARALRRAPGYSLAIMVTLVLCLSINGTILTSLYALVLRPLPFPNADHLVQVFNIGRNNAVDTGASGSSWAQLKHYQEHARAFDGFVLRKSITRVIDEDGGGVRRIQGQVVSDGFFELFGITPVLGRFFTSQEVMPGATPVAVLTEHMWRNEYAADPAVIGRRIRLDAGRRYTIIGVAPMAAGIFDYSAQFFLPFNESRFSGRYGGGSDLWLRLKPGVSKQAGLAELRALETHW